MQIIVNDLLLELGEALDAARLQGAEFRKAGIWRRLKDRIPAKQTRYDANDCTLDLFDRELSLYPCTDSYLTRDRQWRTRASIFAENNRLRKLLFQVVDAQYAAVNFTERFHEACAAELGEPARNGRHIKSWDAPGAVITSLLYPDGLNADFLIEFKDIGGSG